jgi:hypothetical protein
MPTLERPLKEGSVRTYQQKVVLGFPDILASEADADHDTIYAAWNGGVDTGNLLDNCVTSAKIAPDAVGTRELADNLPGTILAAETLTAAQCIPGLTVRSSSRGDGIANAQTSGAEVLLCTLPSLNPRANACIVFFILLQLFVRTTGPGDIIARLKFKRDGTQVWGIDFPFGGLPVNAYVALPPSPAFEFPVPGGAHIYTAWGEIPSGAATIVVGANRGYIQAFELA